MGNSNAAVVFFLVESCNILRTIKGGEVVSSSFKVRNDYLTLMSNTNTTSTSYIIRGFYVMMPMHSPRLNMLFGSRRCDLTSVNVTRLDLWFMMVRQAGEATKSGAATKIGKSATVLSESPSGSPRNSNIPRR